MRSICHLSRRWHQQFCLSPSFLNHQKCLLQWQSIRQYRQQRKPATQRTPNPDFKSNRDIVVREYEQYGNDASTRKPEGPDPLIIERDAIKAQLDKLDEELAIMKQGPFGPSSPFMKSLPVDEREELLRALEANGVGISEIDDLFTEEDLEKVVDDVPEPPTPLTVTLRIPPQDKVYVTQFNKALDDVQTTPDDLRKHLALWKWYLRCQQRVQTFSNFISEDVWNFLWNSQQKTYPKSKHVIMLAKDMMNASVELDNGQTIDYIQALYKQGDTATAIHLWDDIKKRNEQQNDQFWKTGVELYSSVGRPSKAQEIAFAAFDKGQINTEAFIHVMEAWAKSQQPSARNRLWFCYLRLKEKVSIPETVLGQLSTALLHAGQTEMALAIFKDMLVSRKKGQKDSIQLYTDILKQFSTPDASVQEGTINQIGLSALVAFPKTMRNKYFFGAWIKWLIGEGKVDDAALVVELMHEQNIKPDARHLNGIIGAWFRDGSTAARTKAEELAWAMIQSRIELVRSREGKAAAMTESQVKSKLPRFMQRHTPPATIETFSILLLKYTRQADVKKAEELTDIMTGSAQIKPNCFILNHWLYLSLRTSELSAMWNRYSNLKHDIHPDLETFAALWDGLKRNIDRTSPVHTSNYPNPRQLYAEMQAWYESLDPKKRSEADGMFTNELYEQIIRCFCLSTDLHGVFVALDSLHKLFQVLPHDDIVRMVLMQVARTVPAQPGVISRGRRLVVRQRDSSYRSALSNLTGVMEEIMENKTANFLIQGGDPEEVEDKDSPVSQQMRLDAIYTFICMILKRQLAEKGNLSNELIMVAKSMKVNLEKADIQKYLTDTENE